jgi:hypothetical protein
VVPTSPGSLGVMTGKQVDTVGQPQKPESSLVGTFDGVIVIPAVNAGPEPFGGRWPPDNAALAQALHEVLVPRRKDA